jgi:hypothetical protein
MSDDAENAEKALEPAIVVAVYEDPLDDVTMPFETAATKVAPSLDTKVRRTVE